MTELNLKSYVKLAEVTGYKQEAFAHLACSSDRVCTSTSTCVCFEQITPVQWNQVLSTLSKAEQDVNMLVSVLKEATELIEVLTPLSSGDCIAQLNRIHTLLKEFE